MKADAVYGEGLNMANHDTALKIDHREILNFYKNNKNCVEICCKVCRQEFH